MMSSSMHVILRYDDWGQQVRLRIEGTVSDLHAADTQYHKDCMSSFRGPRTVKSSILQWSPTGGPRTGDGP